MTARSSRHRRGLVVALSCGQLPDGIHTVTGVTFTGTLHPYQQEAFDLMVDRRQVLMAYEMGLGKTVVTIAAVEHLMDGMVITEPGIVVCLSALKYQWAEAITKFTGGTSIPLVIDGSPKQRQDQYAEAYDWLNNGVDYVILNYEQIVQDWDHVRKLARGFVIVDEATAIKSFRAQRSRRMKRLRSDINFALTGTPIENGRPEEIFSIMQFVDPELLGRFDLFDRTFVVRNGFGGVDRYRNLPLLNKTLTQAMVRKRQADSDVAPFLPQVMPEDPEDRKLLVNFDAAGKSLYRTIAQELLSDLQEAQNLFGGNFSLEAHYGIASADAGGPGAEIRGRIMSKVTALRMLCDSPELLRISAAKADKFTGGSQYAWALRDRGLLDKATRNPKLDTLVAYLTEQLEADPHAKVVIFTMYREMIDLIRTAFAKYPSVPYTGAMNAHEKETAKQRFQHDAAVRMLVSTDAGGYGVDLPQANMLVNYDLPWASGTAVQRDSRIIRASSKHARIYLRDVLVRGSVEERQWASLQAKGAIAAAVVDGYGSNARGGVDLTVESLTRFLTRLD